MFWSYTPWSFIKIEPLPTMPEGYAALHIRGRMPEPPPFHWPAKWVRKWR